MSRKKWNLYLDIPAGKLGDMEVRHVWKRDATLPTANLRTAMLGGDRRKDISFPGDTRWHELSEDGAIWMTDLPIEQAQCDMQIERMTGRVLVGGLGLGYAAQRLALKQTVKEVVVVEKSRDCIELVARHLKGQTKLRIVHGCLHEYLMRPKGDGRPYNFAFFDIWRSDSENTFFNTVLPLRKLLRNGPWMNGNADGNCECWNEHIMRGQLQMSLFSRITMLQIPPVPGLRALDLTEMCELEDSIWWDWQVPFWRWYRMKKPSQEKAYEAGMFYARLYGLEDWLPRFRRVCRDIVA
jgi:hypothetical protein